MDTRYPAEVPAVFRPGRWKLRPCRSSELGAWPPRARTSLLIIRACRQRSPLSGPCLAASRFSGVGSSAGCVRMRPVSHTRRHSGDSAPFSTAGVLFRVFCLCVVFSLVSMYSLPLYGSSFTRIFLVRRFIIILVKFVILLGSCF